jgi:zinc transport system permease protein
MAIIASLAAMASVISGLAASWYIDTPAGPSIVISAALLFCLSLGFKQKG